MPPTLFDDDPPAKAPSLPSVPVTPVLAATVIVAPLPPVPPRPDPVDSPEEQSVRLWLVARDSFTLFAYWRPSSGELGQLSAAWGPGTWRLRVWLETSEHAAAPEVILALSGHPEATHHFIPVLHAGHRYIAELGHLTHGGRWRSVARSEPVATPPDHGAVAATPPEFASGDSGTKPPAASPRPATKTTPLESSTPAGPRPIRATGAREQAAVEHRIRIVEQEFRRQSPDSSGELVKSQQISHEIFGALPATDSPVNPAAAAMPSSEAMAPGRGPRGFWFEVNAELIVHGRTERGATVTLGGRPVKLRADGSFSFRFALPDGDYSLPAVAISAAHDDQRSAALRFIRQTHYDGAVGVHSMAQPLQTPTSDAVANPVSRSTV